MNKAYIIEKTGNVMTPKGRILWFSVFAPRKDKKKADSAGKYELNLLFPKDSVHDVLKDRVTEAGKEKFPKAFADAKGKTPSSLKSPFKKTAENDKLVNALEEAGFKVEDFPVYYAARSKDRPGLIGPNAKVVDDPEQVYSGRWARMSVDAFGYDVDGGKGIALGLQNIQLLDHDEPLVVGGGRAQASSEFEAVEGAGGNEKSSDALFA